MSAPSPVTGADTINTLSERKKYKVVMVKKITAPEGMPGNNWHRYVIRCDKSEIEGMKPGTLNSVTQHAENVAEDLNLRSGGAWTARKRV